MGWTWPRLKTAFIIVLAAFACTTCGGEQGSATSFMVSVSYPVGKKPTDLKAADMNGDGYPDLLVTSAESNTLHYLEGRGDGQFKEPVIMRAGREPMGIAVADFNGDGIADVAVCNYGDDSVTVYLNQKDGIFKMLEPVKAGRIPLAIAVGDFNNDRKPDLALALRYDKFMLLFGAGDGHFKAGETYQSGGTPSGIAVGDYNEDGKADIALSFNGLKTDFIIVALGNGDGTFQPAKKIDGGHPAAHILQHDVNGDHHLDLLVCSHVKHSVTLFLGNGRGDFERLPDFAGEKGPVFLAAGDFAAGDAIPDLIVTNRESGSISILEGKGDGAFRFPHLNYSVGGGPRSTVGADFNRDGLTDVAVALYEAGAVSVLLRQPDTSPVADN